MLPQINHVKNLVLVIKLKAYRNMNIRIISSIFLLILVIGCEKPPKEEDLAKYPELNIFLPNKTDFQGDRIDLDVGIFSFYFKSLCNTPEEFFRIVDENAKKDGWELGTCGVNYRSYHKNLKRFPAQRKEDYITLKYLPDKNSYFLKWE